MACPSSMPAMATDRTADVAEQELKKLEFRIVELIRTCERLKDENLALRAQYQAAVADRDGLAERGDKVKGRITALLERLRSMESPS